MAKKFSIDGIEGSLEGVYVCTKKHGEYKCRASKSGIRPVRNAVIVNVHSSKREDRGMALSKHAGAIAAQGILTKAANFCGRNGKGFTGDNYKRCMRENMPNTTGKYRFSRDNRGVAATRVGMWGMRPPTAKQIAAREAFAAKARARKGTGKKKGKKGLQGFGELSGQQARFAAAASACKGKGAGFRACMSKKLS